MGGELHADAASSHTARSRRERCCLFTGLLPCLLPVLFLPGLLPPFVCGSVCTGRQLQGLLTVPTSQLAAEHGTRLPYTHVHIFFLFGVFRK